MSNHVINTDSHEVTRRIRFLVREEIFGITRALEVFGVSYATYLSA